MTLLFESYFDGGANGVAVTTANSNFTFVSPAGWTYANTNLVPGYSHATGARVTAAATSTSVNNSAAPWASKNVVNTTVAFNVDSLPTADVSILSFRNASNATVAELRVLTTGAIQIRSGNTQRAVSGTFAAGTKIRAQVVVDATATQMQLKLFTGSGVGSSTPTYDSGLVAATGVAAMTNFAAGLITATTATVTWSYVGFDDAVFPGPAGNTPPTVSATATPSDGPGGTAVTLSSTASDTDGTIASRLWTQTSGPAVTLTGATTATATFTAPASAAGTVFGFSFTATDNSGATATATTTFTIASTSASIAFRTSAVAENTGTSAGTTVVVPAGVVAGDKLLLIFADAQGRTVTAGPGAAWAAVDSAVVPAVIGLQVWHKTAAAGDPGSSVTITSDTGGVGDKRALFVLAYSGAKLGNANVIQATATAAAHAAPGVATVSANAWIVNVFADRGSPSSPEIALGANLAVRQSVIGAGGGSITVVVADDDLVGIGTRGVNTGTGTVVTNAAAEATIALEPGTATTPPPLVNVSGGAEGVEPYVTVTVGGTDTAQSGTIVSRTWTQVDGPDVVLSTPTAATTSFTAPGSLFGTQVILEKNVTDSNGGVGTGTVSVGVLPATERMVVEGAEVPVRFQIVT